MQNRKRLDMLETPIWKLIPLLAVPTIMSNLITTIYNLVDAFFVSTLGTYATAAVSVNGSLEDTLTLIGPLIGTGACSFISRLLGEKKDKSANEILSTCFFTSIFIGIILMVFGLAVVDQLVYWLGATDECAEYSAVYAQYVLLAAPLMIGNYVLSVCLRSEGNATLAMIGVVSGGVLNCFLDPLFIFQFQMGIRGAAIATAISKLVSFCILIYPYVRRHCKVRISIRYFRFTKVGIKEVLSIGSTAFIRSILMTFAGIVINRIAGSYSAAALAAMGLTTRVMRFPFAFILGFGQGYQPVTGYCWGAKQYNRIYEGFRFSSIVSLVGAAVMAAILALAATPIMGLFNSESDPEVLRIGVLCVRLQCITLPIYSWVATLNMFYTAIGKAGSALALSTSRQGYCLIPLIIVLPSMFQVNGLVCCQAGADLLSLAVALPLGIHAFRLIKRLLPEDQSEVDNADQSLEKNKEKQAEICSKGNNESQ